MEEQNEQNFKARAYQVDLLQEAILQNTIIFLPTGSGKTFIALQLMKYLSNDLEKKLDEGGKRSVFLVNTVPLVEQQANFIKRQTHIQEVGEYTGAKNVDTWSKEKWTKEIEENKVLVMTCQIFVDILRHGYVSLSIINLIIMDECHHATKEHPMHQLMSFYIDDEHKANTRILGLTATLLNSNCKPMNVTQEVGTLECSLNSKIATVEDMDSVLGFSSNPNERIEFYNTEETSPFLKKIINHLENCRDKIKNQLYVLDTPKHSNMKYMGKGTHPLPKILCNTVQDFINDIEALGEFGAYQSVMIRYVELEQLKRNSTNKADSILCTQLLTTFMQVRKMISLDMAKYKGVDQIYKLSTPKLLKLFEIVREYSPKLKKKPFSLKGIIFVQRRFTANVLYQIFKVLATMDPDFDFVVPEFVIGMSGKGALQNTEAHLESKWIKKALLRFRLSDANLMMASNVIEEGIDIPRCSLVVRFDTIQHYCSYTQSKGRARSKDSDFVSLVDRAEGSKFEMRYKQFKDVENILNTLLVGKTQNRPIPSKTEVVNELCDSVEPYYTKLAQATMLSSISLINRYCSMLPQDIFTNLTVNYFQEHDTKTNKFRVMLEFPIMCPIREGIKGDWMPNIKDAKRHAALTACRVLHEAGELDDHLMPLKEATKLLDISLSCSFFDHWLKNEPETDSAGNKLSKPGTKSRTRLHKRILPDALTDNMPTATQDLFVHLLEIETDYERPSEMDNRSLRFYDFLNSKQTYAILSTKPLPELCDFPLFLGVGKLKIHIKVNHGFVNLTEEQISQIRVFHVMLFRDVLKVLKGFLVCDTENSGISYLISPVDERLDIDWDVINKFPELITPDNPTAQQRRAMTINSEDYRDAVVIPWYRSINIRTVYIVTRVCDELSPQSDFPTECYDSYRSYFRDKYHLESFHDQPLLEVKGLSFNKLNCLKPRSSKSKRHFKDFDSSVFDEHLVPEFCLRLDFPAILYLKAALLPSILHRITSLVRARELIELISNDLKLQSGIRCSPLQCNIEFITDTSEPETSSKTNNDISLDTSNDSNNSVIGDYKTIRQNEIDNYDFELQKLNKEYPWDVSKEPIDFHRNVENVLTIDLDYYCKFINKKVVADFKVLPFGNQLAICYPPKVESKIEILEKSCRYVEICDMLSVLTAKTANDVCNLERLETLGDSFLKFSVTLYLLDKFKSLNEGHLTYFKGQIIGNRNLFYCGLQKNLAGYMNIYDFAPCADWIPPGFILSSPIKQMLIEKDISAEILYGQMIPKEEVLTGKISPQTLCAIEKELNNIYEDRSESTTLENFIGMLKVSDKTVADCVEALLGQYLCSYGLRTCLRLLGWLKILPGDNDLYKVLDRPPMPAKLSPAITLEQVDFFIPGYKNLQTSLGYEFKDRSYLLQALTHASYTMNRLTDCYQRLEFLGDSILDFLITCYIYENCSSTLSPGDLTDLRSALVNNVTFASLTVRYGFHRYLLSLSPMLNDSVAKFVSFQEKRDHIVDDELLFLLQEDECSVAEYVDVPKVLGDLFESLAGAIFLDSGMDLKVVWNVFYKLMSREITKFSENVPKQVIRLLYESNSKPRFEEVQQVDKTSSVAVPLRFTHDGKIKRVFGIGANKQQAKKAAAKIAIQMLHA